MQQRPWYEVCDTLDLIESNVKQIWDNLVILMDGTIMSTATYADDIVDRVLVLLLYFLRRLRSLASIIAVCQQSQSEEWTWEKKQLLYNLKMYVLQSSRWQ